jgi:hypothetical protein
MSANFDAAAVTLKKFDAVPANEPSLTFTSYIPGIEKLRSENVATPLIAFTLTENDDVPPITNCPPEGPEKMFITTVDVSVVTVCCVTSHTATCIAGNIGDPTAVCVGCT